MPTVQDFRALREAWADARDEVAFYCERDGRAPAHVIAHAEQIATALASLQEEILQTADELPAELCS